MRCFVRNRVGQKNNATFHHRHAFTLLEVVVGTVLMASLVSGVVLATGAHQSKLLFARQKSIAVQAADEMLTSWQLRRSGIPLKAVGGLANGSMKWQTQIVNSRRLCEVPIHIVRLSIHRQTQDESANVLCFVDVVVDARTAEKGGHP